MFVEKSENNTDHRMFSTEESSVDRTLFACSFTKYLLGHWI